MSQRSSEFVPVGRTEIAPGAPLPWDVYDAKRILLLKAGTVVSSPAQLEILLAQGIFRRGGPRRTQYWNPAQARAEAKKAEEVRPDEIQMPFDQVKLMPGEVVQIQPLAEGQAERYTVKVIGIHKPKSLMLMTPVLDGKVLFVKEGQVFLVRAFSGLNVCAFKTRVLKSNLTPFPYLHLGYPATVQAMRVRQAMRAPVSIIIAIYDKEGGKQIASGRIVDLSAGGAKVLSPTAFGQRGDLVYITFKVQLEDIEELVTTPAYIRAAGEQEDDAEGRRMEVIGLQFGELTQDQRLIIMNLVYQNLFADNV